MADAGRLQTFLDGACVDAARDALLRAAEAAAITALHERPVDRLPHTAARRDAYRAFGAEPPRTRNNLEGLLRRAASGLPGVNRLADRYNGVSVLHQVPLGGEDLTRYTGPPRLIRATGTEPFDTMADGADTTGARPAGDRPRSLTC